ncbi:hypothetical protein A7982_13597 [Minicystis rosea]|nr:hypothetical protein A7982_13597 [Minicystis rosea]
MIDVEALLRENAEQRAQNAELLATNARLVTELAKLNERVAELLAIAQRKQRKTASHPEKKPAPPPVVAAEAQQAFDARPKPPDLLEKTKTPKSGARRRSGRSAIPEHLPVEEHRLRPVSCDHCGSSELDVVDEVVEEKLHVVKEGPASSRRHSLLRCDPAVLVCRQGALVGRSGVSGTDFADGDA